MSSTTQKDPAGSMPRENLFEARSVPPITQRRHIRRSKRTFYGIMVIGTIFVVAPVALGSPLITWIAQWNWTQRAELAALNPRSSSSSSTVAPGRSEVVTDTQPATKSIWMRRNEQVFTAWMTQRQNDVWELLGFKRYDIGGEVNVKPLQKYKQ